MKIKYPILLFTLLLVSGACGAPPATSLPWPVKTQNPAPGPTLRVVPVTSATRTKVPAPTARPLVTANASCFDLLAPENDARIPAIGPINFTWQPMQNAARYVVDIKMPDGTTLPFETSNTQLRRYAESTAMGGTYEWQVDALDTSGGTLCTAGPLSYFKPELSKPEKKQPRSQPACPPPARCTNWDPVACACND